MVFQFSGITLQAKYAITYLIDAVAKVVHENEPGKKTQEKAPISRGVTIIVFCMFPILILA